jgi:hypothetical protein
MLEEIGDQLEFGERIQTYLEVQELLATTRQSALRTRLQRAVSDITLNPICHSSRPEK